MTERVLLCAICHQEQVHDEDGWHCANPECHREDTE